MTVLSWMGWISLGVAGVCWTAIYFVGRRNKRRRREIAAEIRPMWNQYDRPHQDAMMLAMEMHMAASLPFRWMPANLRYAETRKLAEEFIAEVENT